MIGSPDASCKFEYRRFVVALMDVMGQTESLLSHGDFPEADEDEPAWRTGINDALACVNTIRKQFPETFEGAQRHFSQVAQRQFSVGIQTFGDSVVVYVPCEDRDTPFVGAYAVLLSSAYTVLGAMVAGRFIPVRCGVELGVATDDLFRGELYGPVLAEVHCLESQKADFPRVVVGERLVHRLRSKLTEEPSSGDIGRRAASWCLELLAEDGEGSHFVDYLGSHFGKFLAERPTPIHLSEWAKQAYAQVRKQELLYMYARPGVASKYSKLREYFESRGYGRIE